MFIEKFYEYVIFSAYLYYSCLCLSGKSESHSVVSDSLWPHGLYSPWNSPGQNTGVGSLSLLQGTFSTQGLNPSLPHCSGFLANWTIREAHEISHMAQMSLWTKQKQAHRHREEACGCQGGGRGEEAWECGVSRYELLCIERINNKVLL